MREHIDLVEASTRPSKLETTPLPYGEKDLAPVLSADSINYHYGHLAKGYAKRYNAGEGKEVTKPEESHTQKVFDLDAGAWRSFRYDRLKKVTASMRFE